MKVSFESSAFVPVGDLNDSQVNTMPLVHMLDDVVRPLGTCFGITNDGLCITARHVIEEPFRQIDRSRSFLTLSERDGHIGALYVSQEVDPQTGHNIGGLLPATRIYFHDALDIALVKLELPILATTFQRLRFPALVLELGLPKVGDKVIGLGYHSMQWTGDSVARSVRQSYSATRGTVEEVLAGGRDRAMLPFPCFRTDARFDPGMSGGPLMFFREDGQLYVGGVICSSIYGEEGSISYGSLIAPSIGIHLDAQNADGNVKQMPLWDLIAGGAVSANMNDVRVVKSHGKLELLFESGEKIQTEALT